MAIDIKMILADGLLALCEKKSVEKITVKDILDKTGVSKKAFYNHFRDKNDLVIYCYRTKVLPPGDYEVTDSENLTKWNISWLESMKKYHRFMKGACAIEDSDSLKNFILTDGRSSDIEWYKETFNDIINEQVELCINYHAGACRYIIIEWIQNDMKLPVETLAALIDLNRMTVLNLINNLTEHKYMNNLYNALRLQ